MPLGAALLDSNGNISAANQTMTTLAGNLPEYLIGINLAARFDEEVRPALMNLTAAGGFDDGADAEIEFRMGAAGCTFVPVLPARRPRPSRARHRAKLLSLLST